MYSDVMIQGNLATRTVTIDGRPLSPKESLKIVNHSPDGFAWGYGGSGPSQLALAILLCYTGRDTAQRLYQRFKWDVVANLEGDFSLSEAEVVKWIQRNSK